MTIRLELEYYPNINNQILKDSIQKIKANKEKWDAPFFIDTSSFIDMTEIINKTSEFMLDSTKNIIVLGTGGSIQTLLALEHLAKKKIFPIYSSRPAELKNCLESTSPDNSVVIAISRAGETLDVNSTIEIFARRGYKVLGLSTKGTLNQILKEFGGPIMDVPDLSGRFAGSISNVGIVPAHIAGINIENFLDGLREGYEYYMNNNMNLAVEFATFLHETYKRNYKIAFSMPYSQYLEGSVGLFVQELSESTGKDNKGMMGAMQPAPLCQHSVLEYLLGGFKGAVVPLIWSIDSDISDISLESTIDYINGQTAHSIIDYQADATFQALIEQGVPSAKISLSTSAEHNIGHLIAFLQSAIYYLCLLIGVNWADNPKVVIGKKICNKALEQNLSASERKKIRVKIADKKFNSF
ncbi:MAG: hypothetical protein JW891_10870 [Candidatus Lokiarchaeota archaeon]|nr:hypothetical protein [Candidatus Lokiarchaeota archaeon]